MTDAEVRYVDKSTVNQAACLTWFMMHDGRITASLAHSVLNTRLDHPSASLVKGICSDSCKPFYSAATTCLHQHWRTHIFQTRQDQASFVPRIPVHRSISCRQLADCDCHSDRVTKGKYDSRSFFLFGEGFKPKTWTCILLPGTVYNLFMCDFVVWTSVVCVVVGVPNQG